MSNFKRFKGLMLAGAVAVAGGLSGCADDNSYVQSSVPDAVSGGGTVVTGTFVDSAVQGATFSIVNALNVSVGSGVTNAAGEFQCLDADVGSEQEFVTLSVGSIVLGNFPCSGGIITPVELTGKTSTRSAAVGNMLVFLQSIDEDMDHSNGIVIPEATSNLAADVTLDFESADFDTEVAAVVTQITGGANTVISTNQALLNFFDTYTALGLAETTTWAFPEPEPETGGGAEPVFVYNDGAQSQWVLWDCCGGATVEEVAADDTSRGMVTQITYSATNTVSGFTFGDPEATAGEFLGGDFDGGTLEFDVLQVAGASGAWIIKVESEDTNVNTGDVLLSSLDCGAPVTGVWQTCSLPLNSATLDLDALQVIAFFPAWDGQDGGVLQVDNVQFVPVEGAGGGDTGGTGGVAPVSVYDDGAQSQWVLWDCCGGATVEEVAADDTARGMVTQITYSATNTVSGFTFGDPEATAGEFLGSDFDGGTLEFDVLQVAGASGAWIIKVESEDTNVNTGDVLLSSLDCGAPVTGVWQTCSLPLSSATLDLDALQVIAFFPAWDGQDGGVLQVDNVQFVAAGGAGGGDTGGTGGTGGVAPVSVYDDGAQSQWVLWDCCGGATVEEVAADDTARGMVTQITYSATNTVSGFTFGDPEATAGEFLGSDFDGGALVFDVLQVAGASGAWIIKVESEDTNVNTGDVLLSSLDCGAPVTGVWQTCSLPLSSATLDLEALQVIAFFPAWDGQDGGVLQVDNVEFVAAP